MGGVKVDPTPYFIKSFKTKKSDKCIFFGGGGGNFFNDMMKITFPKIN